MKKAIDKEELLEAFRVMASEENPECEINHKYADKLLLAYINDPEISEAFHKIRKWYA